jgi:hypothetical protein
MDEISKPRFLHPSRLSNVPPLSCGRTKKHDGARRDDRARGTFTTGDRHHTPGHHEARPSAFSGLLDSNDAAHRAAIAAETTQVGTANRPRRHPELARAATPSLACSAPSGQQQTTRPAAPDQLRQPNRLALPATSTARANLTDRDRSAGLEHAGDARQATRHDSRSTLTGRTKSASPSTPSSTASVQRTAVKQRPHQERRR